MENRDMDMNVTGTTEGTTGRGRRFGIGTLAIGGLLAAGGVMLWRKRGKQMMRKTVTINRPPGEVYAFWHNLENLPKFIPHLESVTMMDQKRSRWVATGLGGMNVEWQAEMLVDTPEKISWRSIEGSQVENAGTVEFRPVNGGAATELRVSLTFAPPVGGTPVAVAVSPYVSSQLEEDLRRLKTILEGQTNISMG